MFHGHKLALGGTGGPMTVHAKCLEAAMILGPRETEQQPALEFHCLDTGGRRGHQLVGPFRHQLGRDLSEWIIRPPKPSGHPQ